MSLFAKKQRQVKEEAAKDAIYEASVKVLLEYGIDGLKMQEIANKAGIAIGTLYNYFDNRESLLYYVDCRLRNSGLNRMEETAKKSAPADKKLNDFIVEFFTFGDKHHLVFNLADRLGLHDRMPTDEKSDVFERAVASIRKIFDEGISQKLFREHDTQKSAKVFFFAIIGILETKRFLSSESSADFSQDLLDVMNIFLERKD